MTTTKTLADEIADVISWEGPLSGSQLVARLRRRRGDVFAALRADDRFERVGEYRHSAWRLRDASGDDAGTGRGRLHGDETSETGDLSSCDAAPGERFLTRCPTPELHRGFGAWYRDGRGDLRCIRCDPQPEPEPLTFEEWLAGGGSEAARLRFEADSQFVREGTATPEQAGRFRLAMTPQGD